MCLLVAVCVCLLVAVCVCLLVAVFVCVCWSQVSQVLSKDLFERHGALLALAEVTRRVDVRDRVNTEHRARGWKGERDRRRRRMGRG